MTVFTIRCEEFWENMTLVLKSTREILDLVGLGNESVVVFKRMRLSKNLIIAIVIISQISFSLPSILFTHHNTNILSRINNPTHIIIGIFIVCLIYLDLLRNRSLIHRTFDLMDEIVATSEYT